MYEVFVNYNNGYTASWEVTDPEHMKIEDGVLALTLAEAPEPVSVVVIPLSSILDLSVDEVTIH